MGSDKFLGLLGIASGAKRLVFGLDRSVAAVAEGKATLCIVAADVSPKSAKEAAFACSKKGVTCLTVGYTLEQLSHATGSRAGVIAVTDGGIASRLIVLAN